jgi:hypothetical protein
MNHPDGSVVDWPAVLARAHRRVALRLALAAGVGVVGAVLLFGGGSATRASIQDEPSPPKGPTGSSDLGSEQPNLVIAAEAAEGAEGEEVKEEGWFTVTNDSATDAEQIEVVATAISGLPPEPFEIPVLAAGESTEEFFFACPAGDEVTVEIESGQPNEGPATVECPAELGGPTGPTGGGTGPTGSTGATEPTEPPEPPEDPESPELD